MIFIRSIIYKSITMAMEDCSLKEVGTSPKYSPETAIMIDFDDTLFPSSQFKTQFKGDISNMTKDEDFIEYVPVVKAFLEQAVKLGRVFIVSNAEIEWLTMYKEYIPIPEQVIIRSARSESGDTYEIQTYQQQVSWKFNVFRSIIENFRINNAISYGDSHVDREAFINATKNESKCKSFKLIESPTIKQLRAQLMLFTSTLEYFVNYENDIDNMITITVP